MYLVTNYDFFLLWLTALEGPLVNLVNLPGLGKRGEGLIFKDLL